MTMKKAEQGGWETPQTLGILECDDELTEEQFEAMQRFWPLLFEGDAPKILVLPPGTRVQWVKLTEPAEVMIVCRYCGTEREGKGGCKHCGAP